MESPRRRRVERLIKQYRALLILSKSIGPDGKAKLDALLEELPAVTTKQLIDAERFHKEQLKVVSKALGLGLPLSDVVSIVEDAERTLPLHLFVVKFRYESYFTACCNRLGNWHEYPPHTCIAIDPSCQTEPTRFDWRLLEASLFEDLAMLWNEVLQHRVEPGSAPIVTKHFHVLTRSVTRAAYALLEGYLNGIACDILITRLSELRPDQLQLLDERREDGRFAPLTLRNKILQYPKIALRREHPAFQENNCVEMDTVLKFERHLRDALMHPTARLDEGNKFTREQRFYDISLDDTKTVLDAVVGLIRRIDKELDGLFGRVSLWLLDRDETDRYSDKTFL